MFRRLRSYLDRSVTLTFTIRYPVILFHDCLV